ncbi:MAG TPA: ABC transporter permease [Phycisphaerae bacterium]|nr:ABC transporter permease [Phycisphaerae bacterium]
MFFLRMLLAALRSLRSNFVRSLLAILGIVIGVGTVIAAVGVIEGVTRDWLTDMQKIGSNVMWIRPGTVRRSGVTVSLLRPLQAEDTDDVQAEPLVAYAAPEIQRGAQVKAGNKNEVGIVVGTRPEFFDVFSYRAKKGKLFTRADDIGRRRVALLGHELAEKLFEQRDPVGDQIRIGRESFTVLGVMKEKGLVGFSDFDKQAYIPISRASSMFNARALTQICVRGVEDGDQEETRSGVASVLRRNHNLQVGEEDDFNVVTQKELFDQFSKYTRIWQSVFFAISGISLVVGGFGIMNIMLVSVTERTREIGVRMAVGAQRRDILTQFLAESSMICVVGAPLGILLGSMLNDVVEANLAPLKPVLAPKIVILAVVVAIGTGIISGLYPAWRASRLDPVDALRYE